MSRRFLRSSRGWFLRPVVKSASAASADVRGHSWLLFWPFAATPSSPGGWIDGLTTRMAIAPTGGTLPSPSILSLDNALNLLEGGGIPQAERADLVMIWDAWGRVVATSSVVKQATDVLSDRP